MPANTPTLAATAHPSGFALVGYARCSTAKQDLAAQRAALESLGVVPDRIYTDHGLSGTNRARPGLDQAPAAVRAGDTLVVPKLDRLARSIPDARAVADELLRRGVRLHLASSVHAPHDPMEADVLQHPGHLRGVRGRLHPSTHPRRHGPGPRQRPDPGQAADRQQKELRRMYDSGDYSISDLAELFSVSRPTVYRTFQRQPTTA